MNSRAALRRDEEAVSAAVATVLLFGGVLSLIGMMLMTMLPVIQELEGSVERNGMLTQMGEYSTQTTRLAESGMPGDSVRVEMNPLDGELLWDNQRGGSWYSATWLEGNSLRLRGVLDLDSTADIRYPFGEVGSVCWDDLRLGPERLQMTRLPNFSGTVMVVPAASIAQNLQPIEVKLTQGEISASSSLMGMSSWNIQLPLSGASGESWLSASADVEVYFLRGSGGATEAPASNPDSATGMGKSWNIPLAVGNTTIHLTSPETTRVEWNGPSNGQDILPAAGGFYDEGATWSKTFFTANPAVLTLDSSSLASVLVVSGDSKAGDAPWPATTGSLLGTEFLPPAAEGTLLLDNPSDSAIVIRYLGGALSVAANDSLRIDWPPATASGAPTLSADAALFMHWLPQSASLEMNRSGSLALQSASDTGRISGEYFNFSTPTIAGNSDNTIFNIQVAGINSQWNVTTWNITEERIHAQSSHSFTANDSNIFRLQVYSGNSVRIISSVGDDGLAHFPHDGEQRCSYLGTQASGWISTPLPWASAASLGESGIEHAWRTGLHPSGLKLSIFSTVVDEPFRSVASAWAFHMPSLVYSFKSSISGMETATRGGAVVTNHPEFQAAVIQAPSDRSGPGPRFAATVPVAYPLTNSIVGSGEVIVDLSMVQRYQLTSSLANEIRRGWDGPYGQALAGKASEDLSYSSDWTTFPQQLRLLNDYKGWVPDPSQDSSETVYHTQGEAIQFTLQISILHHTAKEANS